jgi:hypothetical protein
VPAPVSSTTIVLIVIAVVVIAAIGYFAVRGRRDPGPVAAPDADEDPALSATGEAMIVGDVMPIDSNEPGIPPGTAQMPAEAFDAAPREPDVIEHVPDTPECQSELVEDWPTQRAEIRWSKRFEPRDGALDDATRLSLLRDLGIVRAPWGVPLLAQAYEEEPEIEHRRAALRALAAYRHPDTQPTFESALGADDEECRAIAATALGALRIRAALPS